MSRVAVIAGSRSALGLQLVQERLEGRQIVLDEDRDAVAGDRRTRHAVDVVALLDGDVGIDLALLDPDAVELALVVVDGLARPLRFPLGVVDLTAEALTRRANLPLSWADQKASLGFDG